MKGLSDLLDKLIRKKKEEEKLEIPENYIRCSRCGKIVKKEKATCSLPEGDWVCDDCFFGHAEFIMPWPKEKPSTHCKVCGKELKENYCTRNVCKTCCEDGRCPDKDKCAAYPSIFLKVLERRKEEVIKNPSKRIRYVGE